MRRYRKNYAFKHRFEVKRFFVAVLSLCVFLSLFMLLISTDIVTVKANAVEAINLLKSTNASHVSAEGDQISGTSQYKFDLSEMWTRIPAGTKIIIITSLSLLILMLIVFIYKKRSVPKRAQHEVDRRHFINRHFTDKPKDKLDQ